jgi:hypothetical protein
MIERWEQERRQDREHLMALASKLSRLEEILLGGQSFSDHTISRLNWSGGFPADDGNTVYRGTTGHGHNGYVGNINYGETNLDHGNVRGGSNVNGGTNPTQTVRYSSYTGHIMRSVPLFDRETHRLLETVQTVVNHPFVQNLFRTLHLYGIASRRCQVNRLSRTSIWNNTASMYMRSGRFKCKPNRSLDRYSSSCCSRSRRSGSDVVIRNGGPGYLFLVRIRRWRRRDRLDGWNQADKYVTMGELWVKCVCIKGSIFIHFDIK